MNMIFISSVPWFSLMGLLAWILCPFALYHKGRDKTRQPH